MKMNFETLTAAIKQINEQMAARAGRAINVSLTIRNWLIGCYIAEYELHGADRSEYGQMLLDKLAAKLTQVKSCSRRQLYECLRFYRAYPQIVRTLSAQLQNALPEQVKDVLEKVTPPSVQSRIPPDMLIDKLSYSHFKLLTDLEDPLKRAFYEIECIRGNWSVRELKRQTGSLYCERSGLSENKEKLPEVREEYGRYNAYNYETVATN